MAQGFTIHGCHDGDTLYVDVQLHGTLWLVGEKMRVEKVNCPEMSTPEGPTAKAFTEAWLANHVFTLKLNERRDKYGRLMGDLIATDGAKLSGDLLSSGNAVAYREFEDESGEVK